MRYVLIIQFQVKSIDDYDEVIRIEDHIIQIVGNSAVVDGHDAGRGEMNIFIFTDHPLSTFALIKEKFGQIAERCGFKAAFREADGEEYTVLWPVESTEFNVI